MKKSLKLFNLLLVGSFIFTFNSCSNPDDEYMNMEVKMYRYSCQWPLIYTSCYQKVVQEKDNIEIGVRIGHYPSFDERWETNEYNTGSENRTFAIHRTISDMNNNIVDDYLIPIGDFLSHDYDFLYIDDGGEWIYYYFNYTYMDHFKINQLEKGKIYYAVAIVENDEIISEYFEIIVNSATFYFKTEGDNIRFSNYERDVL